MRKVINMMFSRNLNTYKKKSLLTDFYEMGILKTQHCLQSYDVIQFLFDSFKKQFQKNRFL